MFADSSFATATNYAVHKWLPDRCDVVHCAQSHILGPAASHEPEHRFMGSRDFGCLGHLMCLLRVPQIRGFTNSLREKPMEVVTTPGALGNMAGVELPDNPITREFADFVAAAELASYGSVQGRGARNPMILRPSMQVSVNQPTQTICTAS